jgi:hypothetical protein
LGGCFRFYAAAEELAALAGWFSGTLLSSGRVVSFQESWLRRRGSGFEDAEIKKDSDWLWAAGSVLLNDPMGSLKKRRKAKINKHKRRKKLRLNRHKKRTWQK